MVKVKNNQISGRMVLLGAGASMPLIPSAFKMTERMLDAVEESNVPSRIRQIVRTVVASLQFGTGLRDERPTGLVNIEEVVNVLSTLEGRHTLEAASLIGAWHPIVEHLDRITVQPNLPKMRGVGVARGVPYATDFQLPSREIPAQGKVFTQTKRFLVQKLKELVWIRDPKSLSYLKPLIQQAAGEAFTIATLNYDNTIELVAEQLGLRVDTGIEQWRQTGTFAGRETGAVSLRKIHGSINWSLNATAAPLRRDVLAEAEVAEMSDAEYEPALIFGGRNKLTVRGPFLDLLLDFREQLQRSKELIVIGYSFGDEHINEYIAQWLDTNQDAKMTLINGPGFEEKAEGFAKLLLTLGEPRVFNTSEYAKEGIKAAFDQSGVDKL